MNFTIKTTELQDMVGKAIKCTSNNKLIPLTSLLNIKVKDNILTLTTTDATNYFYVSKPDKVYCEDFEISVLADLFTKLVQKTTSENIEIIASEGLLKVKGNGTYTMELPLDENGNVIKFPSKLSEDFEALSGTLKLSTVKSILNYNKPSLAVNMKAPSLTCYYCADKVVTSDSYKVCSTNIKVFDKPMLLTSTLVDLLGVMSEEDIMVTFTESDMVFRTSIETIYSPITPGVNTYPITAIDNLVNRDFTSSCKVSKSALLNILDRLSLFVSPYDKKGIYLTFTPEGIMCSSKKLSGEELIPYISSNNFADYTCCIDIDMLRSQVSTQEGEEIELGYGSDVAIKLTNKNIIQLVALIEDDRFKEE